MFDAGWGSGGAATSDFVAAGDATFIRVKAFARETNHLTGVIRALVVLGDAIGLTSKSKWNLHADAVAFFDAV